MLVLMVLLIGGALAGDWRSLEKGNFFQQTYINNKERFIKFDTKENEVEIELGVSVPVVKIPMMPDAGRQSDKEESAISISAPGLVVAGTLMLTTYIIIPLLFSSTTYRDLKLSKSGEDLGKIMDRVQQQVYKSFVGSRPCFENLICLAARKFNKSHSISNSSTTMDRWLDGVLKAKWLERLIKNTFIEEALFAGRNDFDCWKKYQDCPMVKNLFSKRE